MIGRTVAIARHSLADVRRDPLLAVVLMAMPVIVAVFTRPLFKGVLEDQGYSGVSGAEQAVPGLAVLFSFSTMGFLIESVFREHMNHTWDRVRATPASALEVAVGKAMPGLVLTSVQLAALFGAGSALMGLQVRGPLVALVLVGAAFAVWLTSFAMLLIASFRTAQQCHAVEKIVTLILAGLGGALVPVSALPGWAQAVAPFLPTTWALRGFRAVVLDGAGVGDVLVPVLVLLGFAALCAVGFVRRFRFNVTRS